MLTKYGGSLGESGSAMWNFDPKGFRPKNTIELDESNKKKLDNLTHALDELEDINDFYTNAT